MGLSCLAGNYIVDIRYHMRYHKGYRIGTVARQCLKLIEEAKNNSIQETRDGRAKPYQVGQLSALVEEHSLDTEE
jgi:hypothetical protein